MAAAATTRASEIFQGSNNKNDGEVSRHEIQAAIAKAVELRALHAALLQGSSPASLKFSAASPASNHHVSHLSAQDYPVFTPTYEDDPLPGYQQIQLESRNLPESWDEYVLEGGGDEDKTILSDYRMKNTSSRKGLLPFELRNSEPHMCSGPSALRASPGPDFCRSRRNSLGDNRSVSSCNKCKPAIISSDTDNSMRNGRNSNLTLPLTDTHISIHSQQPRTRGLGFSWLFPKLKRKHKSENSPSRTEPEEVPQIFKDLGILSMEMLKKELMQAHDTRDAALTEVSEMRSSFGELKQKLQHLETYCEDLKKALRQAAQGKNYQGFEKLGNVPVKGISVDASLENSMAVSDEVMVEGFVQIVSEARLSVNQFCKTLVGQIEETDKTLKDNLNMLLQPYKLSLTSKYSKAVLYHLEAIINQSLYQDFENCVFQKNGSPKLLDLKQHRQAQFSSFVALRNLSWNEVLRKGTKYYSEEFSKFCDHKMSCIITNLNWTRPWPEQLLQAFFVAAKCIWLLHLLAFSFSPPLGILRVEESRSFDQHYMEDVLIDRQRSQGGSQVKIMVMPGFYVQDKVLKCKVVCRYKSVA
ncbi:hypothetical protein ACET3Z_001721 [Daucus carota]